MRRILFLLVGAVAAAVPGDPGGHGQYLLRRAAPRALAAVDGDVRRPRSNDSDDSGHDGVDDHGGDGSSGHGSDG